MLESIEITEEQKKKKKKKKKKKIFFLKYKYQFMFIFPCDFHSREIKFHLRMKKCPGIQTKNYENSKEIKTPWKNLLTPYKIDKNLYFHEVDIN